MTLTKDNKQATKRNRYSVLSSFYNFSINTGLPSLANPCNTTVIKKIFKRPPPILWQIVDKDTIDESIFRTATAVDVINTLSAAQVSGQLKPTLKKYLKPAVLILDELGYLPIDKRGADLLFQVISGRYEKGPLVIT